VRSRDEKRTKSRLQGVGPGETSPDARIKRVPASQKKINGEFFTQKRGATAVQGSKSKTHRCPSESPLPRGKGLDGGHEIMMTHIGAGSGESERSRPLGEKKNTAEPATASQGGTDKVRKTLRGCRKSAIIGVRKTWQVAWAAIKSLCYEILINVGGRGADTSPCRIEKRGRSAGNHQTEETHM